MQIRIGIVNTGTWHRIKSFKGIIEIILHRVLTFSGNNNIINSK